MSQKNCLQCSNNFEISDDDLKFYEKVSPVFHGKKYIIPPPTLCFDCRVQRKLTWRNERVFYHRNCDLTGQKMISIHSPDAPHKVYYFEEWAGDNWDPMEHGRNFDFSRSFFDQFYELSKAVPRPSVFQKNSINCHFNNLVGDCKNCYMTTASSFNEDSYYCTFLQRNNSVVDCLFIFESQFCYECIDVYNSYKLYYSNNCKNCNESYFLDNCQSCSHCFGCFSLVNKKYHIFNKEYSEEEYFRRINMLLSEKHLFEKAKGHVLELKKKFPQKYYSGIQNENVTGDHISYSKNTHNSYDCTYLEDCKNCIWMHRANDCQDCYAWGLLGCEMGYENHLVGEGYHKVQFCNCCSHNLENLMYCDLCEKGCKNLFGCIGLRAKKYCILNKQYTEEEYNTLVPKIIEHMQSTKEWGEFFPEKYSQYAYNETVAQEYYPLEKEEVVKRGWKWRDEDPKNYQPSSYNAPVSIEDVDNDITEATLACEGCRKNYRIIPQELKFYRDMKLSVPKKCPDCRHYARMEQRNPRCLWKKNCMKCNKEMESSFAPDRPERIYCEGCYLAEVY